MTKNQKIISAVVGIIFIGGIAFLSLLKGNIPKTANTNLALEKKPVEVQQEVQKGKEQPPREVSIKAFRFGYEPNVINATKGEKIKINIENTDVLHGMRIPDLGISGNEVLEFTADQVGEFSWYCTNMCGEGHRAMQGKLIVK
ncbi:MAG: cupredoxin domain-containing protein [bacterium]|nr:cupredoxin domain-containing protein [bacterium]